MSASNERVKTQLKTLIQKNEVPGTLLLTGGPSDPLFDTALSFSKELVASNKEMPPDLLILEPPYKIDEIRSMIKVAKERPHEAPVRCIIMPEIENLTPVCANAL